MEISSSSSAAGSDSPRQATKWLGVLSCSSESLLCSRSVKRAGADTPAASLTHANFTTDVECASHSSPCPPHPTPQSPGNSLQQNGLRHRCNTADVGRASAARDHGCLCSDSPTPVRRNKTKVMLSSTYRRLVQRLNLLFPTCMVLAQLNHLRKSVWVVPQVLNPAMNKPPSAALRQLCARRPSLQRRKLNHQKMKPSNQSFTSK